MSVHHPLADILAGLPPVWPEDVLPALRAQLAASPRKVFILDDDPTGTQTVRDLYVVTNWDLETLRRQWSHPEPGCFILTNSRAITEVATRTLHHELAANLQAAADGRPFTVISRSDSTLRGHYPAETDTLEDALGGFDLTVLAPFFRAGGRYTLQGEHFLIEGDSLVPVAETPFARDPAFGFRHSYLPAYVEEKTGGRIPSGTVQIITLETLRKGGPDAVARALSAAPSGTVCTVDSCEDRDIEVFAAGALRVEAAGRRILYRSAASFVAARVGQAVPPLLPAAALRPPVPRAGLVVVGSYVPKTTAQLEALRSRPGLRFLELTVERVLDPIAAPGYLADLATELNRLLAAGQNTVLHTSRAHVAGIDATASLTVGTTVSRALISVMCALRERPGFLIAKGGITSSDLATRALEVREARILGQLLPGVPVWELGAESRFPGLPYVVFPGNVGDDQALRQAMDAFLD